MSSDEAQLAGTEIQHLGFTLSIVGSSRASGPTNGSARRLLSCPSGSPWDLPGLPEGLSELFTVNRLGLPKRLRRCLNDDEHHRLLARGRPPAPEWGEPLAERGAAWLVVMRSGRAAARRDGCNARSDGSPDPELPAAAGRRDVAPSEVGYLGLPTACAEQQHDDGTVLESEISLKNSGHCCCILEECSARC